MNRTGPKYFALLLMLLLGGLPNAALTQTRTNKAGLNLGDYEPNLPLVLIEAKTSIDSDQKVPCTLRVVCPKGAVRGDTNVLSGGAMLHGASSRGYPKKSYKLSLDAGTELLDMRKDGNWILNAAHVDGSFMRHKLSYDLFRALSAGPNKRYAVASRFVEVYVNRRYNGVYLLMERLDKRLMELRSYNSNDLHHACVYKAIDHGADFGSAGHNGYEQRDPNPEVKPYWQPLEVFNLFASTARPEKLWEPQSGIESRLDLENAIDFHLLVLLTSNSDGIDKNFIFARNGQPEGKCTQRFFFAPWDYDGTFGQNWDGNLFPASVWLSNNLFDRLLQNKTYREKFIARWKTLRPGPFSPKAIQAMIEDNVRTLGAAPRRNALKWGASQRSFEQDIAHMKSWTEERVAWLDQEIGKNLATR